MTLSEFKQEILKIFKRVKRDVEEVFRNEVTFSARNVRRAGLSLGLADMGMYRGGFIGGMHFAPGTEIVMNKSPLRIIIKTQPFEIVWAYTYHILLVLYIKSLGVIDKRQCKLHALKVSKEIFKNADHPANIMARNGIQYFIPDLKITYIPPDRRPNGMPIEYIRGFDDESQSYYS